MHGSFSSYWAWSSCSHLYRVPQTTPSFTSKQSTPAPGSTYVQWLSQIFLRCVTADLDLIKNATIVRISCNLHRRICSIASGVARTWCWGGGTKLRERNSRVTQKYCVPYSNYGADVPEDAEFTILVFYWVGNHMELNFGVECNSTVKIPDKLNSRKSIATFCQRLKTFLFQRSFLDIIIWHY